MRRIGILLCLLLVAACSGKGKTLELQPFIGGTEGATATFVDMRSSVFDGGKDPFDVVVKIDNKGESPIKREELTIRIDGINPLAFGKTEEQLTKRPSEEILANTKTPEEKIISSPSVFVEFNGLNHLTTITGSKLSYPIRAHLCYAYKTKAISKACIRRNILSQEEGICTIDEQKPVYNSGAPVHIENIKETARGADKIGISFDIKHKGKGTPFDKGSQCPDNEKTRNKVFIRMETKMSGLSCTGLNTIGTGAEGTVQLFDGIKTISCTQTVSKGDYEQPITITAEYDYEDYAQTELTVKHAGDQTEQAAPLIE